MTGRIVYDMPNDEYRAHKGLSYSESKLLQRSPMHLRYWLDHPEARTPPSPAQAFGTMVHTAVLEPTTFDQRYAIGPAVNKNTAQWRDFKVQCETNSLMAITAEDREAAFLCARNVREHPVIGPLMQAPGHSEVSIFWTDPVTGCECKARMDREIVRKQPLVCDLKTSQDASRKAFTRSVVTFEYARQADWYTTGYYIATGVEPSPMLFIVVESLPPFAVAGYVLDRWFMAQAKKTNHALRSLWQHCLEYDSFPGYDPSVIELEAPRFALDEELRELQREEESYA